MPYRVEIPRKQINQMHKKGRLLVMERTTISEVGTINVEKLEVAEGQLELRIPVEVISQQMDKKLDELIGNFAETHPNVAKENIFFESRLVFSLNRYNPEFSLMLIIFDGENQGTVEIWDELQVTLSEEQKKQFRKLAWEKLGEALFGI